MVVTPDSRIILLKSPLKLDNYNQITFNNSGDQFSYFYNLPKIEEWNYSYNRKDGVIRVSTDGTLVYEDLLHYNYCMYQNTHYDSKWFYAFVTGVKYVNDGMTEVSIETDVFQTWQFDLVYKQSFIEREHVSNDTIGRHTVPESIDTGDFISCKLQPSFSASMDTCFVVAVTELLDNMSSYSTINQLLPVGLYYIGVQNLVDIKTLVKAYDTAGKGEAVNSVFVIPKAFFSSWTNYTGMTQQISFTIRFDYSSTITVNKVNYVGNDYVPKNNKLFTYPYSFLQVSNHSGQVVNYKWENFNLLQYDGMSNDINFILRGTFTPGGSFKLFPLNYNNILNNNDDTINLGKFPIGAFNNDVYTNWLTQNGVNLGFTKLNATEAGYAVGGIQSIVGLAELAGGSPAGVSELTQGVGSILGTMQSDYRHSLVPDTVDGNLNSGDVNFAFNLNNLEFKRMSVKNEFAMIIDDFFTLYGYKVNDVSVPNIHKRSNWDYMKCINVNLEGDIPEADMDKIRGLFNNGCTFWHTTSQFLNYSATNSIL